MERSNLAPTRRRLLQGLLAGAGAWTALPVGAQAGPDPSYEPKRGQSGKDVIWIATPDAVVRRLLQLAGVRPTDTVVDLGSGDGKVVIAAARDFRARALGIEFNPEMVALSQRHAASAGVADKARFVQGDIFETDFSAATVVMMYLLPHLNLRLRPRLFAMAPGTRVVSHDFDMDDWSADEVTHAGTRVAHLWIVPANAGGRWQLRFPMRSGAGEAVLDIEQTFQKLRGAASFNDFRTTLRAPLLTGTQLSFAFTDHDGDVRHFQGTVEATQISGTVSMPSGARAPFTAVRQGVAPSIGGVMGVDPARIDALAGALSR